MWCKVPDDIDIIAKETQVHTFSFETVDFSQVAALHELSQFIYGWIILKRVSYHQYPLSLLSQCNQFLRLSDTGGKWLLNEYVLIMQ